MTGPGTRNNGRNSNLNLKLDAVVVFSRRTNERIEPHVIPVTFGVDSGDEVTVISPDTANDHPREHGPKKAMRDSTGKSLEDMGDMG